MSDALKSSTPKAQGVEPTDDDARAVGRLVNQHGEAKAAEQLRCDRFTLCRIAARWSVRPATLAFIRQRLAAPPMA